MATPEGVADVVLKASKKEKYEVFVPRVAGLLRTFRAWSINRIDKLMCVVDKEIEHHAVPPDHGARILNSLAGRS